VQTRLLAKWVMAWSKRRAAAMSSTKDSAVATRDTMSSNMVGNSGMAMRTAGTTGVKATAIAEYDRAM